MTRMGYSGPVPGVVDYSKAGEQTELPEVSHVSTHGGVCAAHPEPMKGLAWARLAAASIGAALSPLLGTEAEQVRLALVAGLLWLPWAWVALLLTEKRGQDWRIAAAFVGDLAVLSASFALLPDLRIVPATAIAGTVFLHGIVVTSRVILTGRNATAMFAAAEQRLGFLLQQMPIVMWTTDEELRVTSWLGARDEWRSLLPEAGDPTSLADRLAERNPPLLDAHETVLRGRVGDCEILLGNRTYQVFLRPLHDPSDAITGVVGAALDVTDRRLAEDAKTMFLATASHELKTPLTVIKGFAETLARSELPEDESFKAEALKAIARRSEELTKIVDRLLLSSRIETGKVEVNLENFDLRPIVTDRTRSFEGATGRQVLLRMETFIPLVVGDVVALATSIDHLVDNAIKYSPDGDPVLVTVASTDEEVVIEVIDGGIGMSADQLARCFERFWQADGTDRRRFPGTGIGLFIVDSLATAMGGRVEARSQPDEGSTFTLALLRADIGPRDPFERDEPGIGDSSVIREFMRQIGIPTGGGA